MLRALKEAATLDLAIDSNEQGFSLWEITEASPKTWDQVLLKVELFHELGWLHGGLTKQQWVKDSSGQLKWVGLHSSSPMDDHGLADQGDLQTTWSDDVFDLGQLLKEALEKNPRAWPNFSAWKALMLRLMAPHPDERTVSLSSLRSEVLAMQGLSVIGREDSQAKAQRAIDSWSGGRNAHRAFLYSRCHRRRQLFMDEKGVWHWLPVWTPHRLPPKVAQEIEKDLRSGELPVDMFLTWMRASSNSGLPLEVIPSLALGRDVRDSESVLGNWLNKGVVRLKGDRCLWMDSRFSEAVHQMCSQDELSQKREILLEKLKDLKNDGLSLVSQLLSLAQSGEGHLEERLLWHQRAALEYIKLEAWLPAKASLDWLWSQSVKGDKWVAMRIECELALGNVEEAKKLFDHFQSPEEYLHLKVRFELTMGETEKVITFLEESLFEAGAPWMQKRLRKIRFIQPERIWSIIQLMSFSAEAQARHLEQFKASSVPKPSSEICEYAYGINHWRRGIVYCGKFSFPCGEVEDLVSEQK